MAAPVTSTTRDAIRRKVLEALNISISQIEELLVYNANQFEYPIKDSLLQFPLPDEKYVDSWMSYKKESRTRGTYQVLKEKLVQLNFPVEEGVSKTREYQVAVKKGIVNESRKMGIGLKLESPEGIALQVHQTPAGKIPIISASDRLDFVSLVQALVMKNEPVPVPESMGALTVSGYNNWARIEEIKKEWQKTNGNDADEISWGEEFGRIRSCRELYQDRFIILGEGAYSGVNHSSLGLSKAGWISRSYVIRQEHECAHYFTRRVFNSMRNHLIDELLADYMGITAVEERFSASLFLRFMGLESYPEYRIGGRLENYRGQPPLTDGAFEALKTLVYQAANNLESIDRQRPVSYDRHKMLMTLTQYTLEELASQESLQKLERSYSHE